MSNYQVYHNLIPNHLLVYVNHMFDTVASTVTEFGRIGSLLKFGRTFLKFGFIGTETVSIRMIQ